MSNGDCEDNEDHDGGTYSYQACLPASAKDEEAAPATVFKCKSHHETNWKCGDNWNTPEGRFSEEGNVAHRVPCALDTVVFPDDSFSYSVITPVNTFVGDIKLENPSVGAEVISRYPDPNHEFELDTQSSVDTFVSLYSSQFAGPIPSVNRECDTDPASAMDCLQFCNNDCSDLVDTEDALEEQRQRLVASAEASFERVQTISSMIDSKATPNGIIETVSTMKAINNKVTGLVAKTRTFEDYFKGYFKTDAGVVDAPTAELYESDLRASMRSLGRRYEVGNVQVDEVMQDITCSINAATGDLTCDGVGEVKSTVAAAANLVDSILFALKNYWSFKADDSSRRSARATATSGIKWNADDGWKLGVFNAGPDEATAVGGKLVYFSFADFDLYKTTFGKGYFSSDSGFVTRDESQLYEVELDMSLADKIGNAYADTTDRTRAAFTSYIADYVSKFSVLEVDAIMMNKFSIVAPVDDKRTHPFDPAQFVLRMICANFVELGVNQDDINGILAAATWAASYKFFIPTIAEAALHARTTTVTSTTTMTATTTTKTVTVPTSTPFVNLPHKAGPLGLTVPSILKEVQFTTFELLDEARSTSSKEYQNLESAVQRWDILYSADMCHIKVEAYEQNALDSSDPCHIVIEQRPLAVAARAVADRKYAEAELKFQTKLASQTSMAATSDQTLVDLFSASVAAKKEYDSAASFLHDVTVAGGTCISNPELISPASCKTKLAQYTIAQSDVSDTWSVAEDAEFALLNKQLALEEREILKDRIVAEINSDGLVDVAALDEKVSSAIAEKQDWIRKKVDSQITLDSNCGPGDADDFCLALTAVIDSNLRNVITADSEVYLATATVGAAKNPDFVSLAVRTSTDTAIEDTVAQVKDLGNALDDVNRYTHLIEDNGCVKNRNGVYTLEPCTSLAANRTAANDEATRLEDLVNANEVAKEGSKTNVILSAVTAPPNVVMVEGEGEVLAKCDASAAPTPILYNFASVDCSKATSNGAACETVPADGFTVAGSVTCVATTTTARYIAIAATSVCDGKFVGASPLGVFAVNCARALTPGAACKVAHAPGYTNAMIVCDAETNGYITSVDAVELATCGNSDGEGTPYTDEMCKSGFVAGYAANQVAINNANAFCTDLVCSADDYETCCTKATITAAVLEQAVASTPKRLTDLGVQVEEQKTALANMKEDSEEYISQQQKIDALNSIIKAYTDLGKATSEEEKTQMLESLQNTQSRTKDILVVKDRNAVCDVSACSNGYVLKAEASEFFCSSMQCDYNVDRSTCCDVNPDLAATCADADGPGESANAFDCVGAAQGFRPRSGVNSQKCAGAERCTALDLTKCCTELPETSPCTMLACQDSDDATLRAGAVCQGLECKPSDFGACCITAAGAQGPGDVDSDSNSTVRPTEANTGEKTEKKDDSLMLIVVGAGVGLILIVIIAVAVIFSSGGGGGGGGGRSQKQNEPSVMAFENPMYEDAALPEEPVIAQAPIADDADGLYDEPAFQAEPEPEPVAQDAGGGYLDVQPSDNDDDSEDDESESSSEDESADDE
jgi:hypothetical protein